ncbi:MAG: hypothetical protein PWP31_1337 [Clostridia bacterium]|nr:hypothetical protein [Clostridia bacterium]
MEVIALVGPSGTGKSFRALAVARDYRANVIIDDGLLIQGSRILAGTSAKEQPTRVGAIKTALFSEEEHAQQVQDCLAKIRPERILIVSTSRKMVERIINRLNLNTPTTWVNITDVATIKEISKAQKIRRQLGKHVIPVPTVEVKPRFKEHLIEPLRIFLNRRKTHPGKNRKLWVEQTTVRPTFNSMGHFYISNNVIEQLASQLVATEGLISQKVKVKKDDSGRILIDLEVIAPYGVFLLPILRSIQNKVKTTITNMTALEIKAVNITVRDIKVK